MSELLGQLGIDWKLLLSQGVNFFILLAVLTYFVYRPLLRMMAERRKKIEFGIRGAEEIEGRLKKIDEAKEEKLREADKTAVEIIGSAEKKGNTRFNDIVYQAQVKAENVLSEAATIAEHKRQEELETVTAEAKELIKRAIVKTVELDPKYVDEALVNQAIKAVKEKAV